MRTRRGRSYESLIARLSPPDAAFSLRHQVKRPTLFAFQRIKRLTPQERIDSSFALLEFASSLRSRRDDAIR
jgi:hypothetical protein